MIPFTGIMLMMVMASAWSVLLINAGFLFLALEALLGGTSRKWLVLPIAWFLGYGAVAWQSHTAAARFLTDIDAFNAGKSLSFDPAKENLVFQQGTRGTLSAEEFVRQFDVPLTFEIHSNLGTASHFVHAIGWGNSCQIVRNSQRAQAAGMSSSGGFKWVKDREKPWRDGKLVASPNPRCIVSSPYDPVGEVVKVEASTLHSKDFFLESELTQVTLEDSKGHKVEVRHGRAWPLSKFPRPIAGCALDSGKPAWVCFYEFGREKTADGSVNAQDIIANALGLTRSGFDSGNRKIEGVSMLDLENVLTRK